VDVDRGTRLSHVSHSMTMNTTQNIPVKIGNTKKWISGVNNNTTCSDIVKKVVDWYGSEHGGLEPSQHYALVEVWRGVNRVIQSDTPILSLWRSWAEEQINVCFVVKRNKNPRPLPPLPPSENKLEKMRAEISSSKPRRTEAGGGQSKRLLRRNSSVNRQRKPPDIFHPKLLKQSREELMVNIESSIKDIVKRSEQLKLEIGKLEKCEEEKEAVSDKIKIENNDTSDSGIVTDDSEAKACNRPNRKSKSYYEEAWKIPPKDPCSEFCSEIEKIQKVNSVLEKNEEQILALSVEYKMLSKKQDFGTNDSILNNFLMEVKRLRSWNSVLLQEITRNRDDLEKINSDRERRQRMERDLEGDLVLIEQEETRLENSLSLLSLVDLSTDNVTSLDITANNLDVTSDAVDKICDKFSTNCNHQLPDSFQILPSTLV